MLLKSYPFVVSYVEELSGKLEAQSSDKQRLSRIQKVWISFCLSAMLLTNTLCWACFERVSFGSYKARALSWMFLRSLSFWEQILNASVALIFEKFEINNGTLVVDDSDRTRSKNTSHIYGVHKILDKKTGGYCMAQNIVMLLLVSDKISVPVGFKFYLPDPKLAAWELNEKILKEQNVPKKKRPAKPERSVKFPTKQDLATQMVEEFRANHPKINVKGILADAAFLSPQFSKNAKRIYPKAQIVSQIKSNQKVLFKGKPIGVNEFFKAQTPLTEKLSLRGGEPKTVHYSTARLEVCSHGKILLIVALKYGNEDEYRYLAASDLTWRGKDIVYLYAFRWLVEVFFFDWKGYEGWAQLACQHGVDGSFRGLILSLLLDHCLLYHPEQSARLKNQKPAETV